MVVFSHSGMARWPFFNFNATPPAFVERHGSDSETHTRRGVLVMHGLFHWAFAKLGSLAVKKTTIFTINSGIDKQPVRVFCYAGVDDGLDHKLR